MCSAQRYRLTDMQHDLFQSGHDLDMRSNFQNDLSRSNYSSFNESRQETRCWQYKWDTFLSQVIKKHRFHKTPIFSCCPVGAKPWNWGQIWEQQSERPVKELSTAFFRGAVTLLVPELCVGCFENCLNRQNLTFYIPRRAGGVFTPPPQVFRRYLKNGGAQRRRFCHTLSYIISA